MSSFFIVWIIWIILLPVWDVRYELIWRVQHSIGITWTGPHDQTGRAARQSGMCPCEQNGEIHRTICNQKHCLFCSIEYEIWAPIVVLICCIFMNTIIVNTSTYFNSLLFWMIAQNVKENVTGPWSPIGQRNIIKRHHWLFSFTT